MTGQDRIYKQFTTPDGTRVTLRPLESTDLESLLSFINSLVKEKRDNPNSPLYSGFDKKVTRREEREWVRKTLGEIQLGNVISVLAEIEGKIVANGEVTRGKYHDTRHHGQLGLTMTSAYRGKGIGRKVIKTLVRESRRAGLRGLEVEFLASNNTARRAYEKEGFKQAGVIPGKIFRNGKHFAGLIMARLL